MKLGLKNIKAITRTTYMRGEARDYWGERDAPVLRWAQGEKAMARVQRLFADYARGMYGAEGE
jgi:hypothetical protein